MNRGPSIEEAITVACIMALIDSGAAISLVQYSTYQHIDDSFKTHTSHNSKIEQADGLPMTALGMTALHLRIAEFKFIHNVVICDRLPDMEIIFGIDIPTFSISYAWDSEKNCYIQRDGKFLTYTMNFEQKATIGTVKSSLKIPLRHNGVVSIKITGPVIKEHMAYFITDDNSTKGRDPNINIINGIHSIKGKTSVNVFVSNYTNKHIKFNKEEYTGCLQPAITANMTTDQPYTHSPNSVTLQMMMAEQVQPDIFSPPCHKLKPGIQSKLDTLLKEYASQFAKDEVSIGTTPLSEMTIDNGNSEPMSQKPYPIAMKNYQWVKEEIGKLLTAKVVHSSRSSWSAPIIVVPKGDGGKQLVIDYKVTKQGYQEVHLAYA